MALHSLQQQCAELVEQNKVALELQEMAVKAMNRAIEEKGIITEERDFSLAKLHASLAAISKAPSNSSSYASASNEQSEIRFLSSKLAAETMNVQRLEVYLKEAEAELQVAQELADIYEKGYTELHQLLPAIPPVVTLASAACDIRKNATSTSKNKAQESKTKGGAGWFSWFGGNDGEFDDTEDTEDASLNVEGTDVILSARRNMEELIMQCKPYHELDRRFQQMSSMLASNTEETNMLKAQIHIMDSVLQSAQNHIHEGFVPVAARVGVHVASNETAITEIEPPTSSCSAPDKSGNQRVEGKSDTMLMYESRKDDGEAEAQAEKATVLMEKDEL